VILFTSLFALAAVDSVNPSALVVTLVLLARPRPMRTVPIYVSAIAVTYFSLGVLALLGVASFRETSGAALESQLGFLAQAVVGGLMLVWGLPAPTRPMCGSTECGSGGVEWGCVPASR